MKLVNFNIPVSSDWLITNHRRLDSSPYLDGAYEARSVLEKLPKDVLKALKTLTRGYDNQKDDYKQGIFNGPRFPRVYVDNPEYGIPFLGSTDILAADLSRLPFLSKEQVRLVPQLVIDQGWTLITCSGTIGRMAYARADMQGMVGSQHFMRVVPDTNIIPSGYLYSYLSSKYGIPLVVAGTYGAIIQHIEPYHIADLPVPRLGDVVEAEADRLVHEAAALRVEASKQHQQAIELLLTYAGLPPVTPEYMLERPFTSYVASNEVQNRLGGLYHVDYHHSVLNPIAQMPTSGHCLVKEFAANISEPKRMKRIALDEAKYGTPFFGTTAIFWNDPIPSYSIPERQAVDNDLIVNNNTILVPRYGQLPGIIGHAVLPHGDVIGSAVSEHVIRVICTNDIRTGYLFAFLSSEYGRRQLKSRAFGTSIPTLDVEMVGEVHMPLIAEESIAKIGLMAIGVANLRSNALRREKRAIQLVENVIEEVL